MLARATEIGRDYLPSSKLAVQSKDNVYSAFKTFNTAKKIYYFVKRLNDKHYTSIGDSFFFFVQRLFHINIDNFIFFAFHYRAKNLPSLS